MKFSYFVDGYSPRDARAFVVYTPDPTEPGNEKLEPIGAWVNIPPTSDEDDIHSTIVRCAPVFRWMIPDCKAAHKLVGKTFNGQASRPTPENAAKFNIRPAVLTHQMRVALEDRGVLDDVTRAINAVTDQKKKRRLLAKLEYSPQLKFTDELSAFIASTLQLDDPGLMTLFSEARAVD